MAAGFPERTVVRLLPFACLLHLTSAVYLENNGYKDVVVSFSTSTNPRDIDFSVLKAVFKRASTYLFEATRRRSYFSDIVVAVPQTWDEALCDEISQRSEFPPRVATVYVQESFPARVQHSRKCGERGEIIFIPSDWFAPTQNDIEGIAREFVKLWATYRYGVFDEKPLVQGSCVSSDGRLWSPTGCYNIHSNSTLSIDSNGLPQCVFHSDSALLEEATSSIMFSTKYPNVTQFCDGSRTYPHNPVAHTHHNILCNRKPVWNVMKNSEDFRYGRNPPIKNESFNPSLFFWCHREKKRSLMFVVQNASVVNNVVNNVAVSEIVKELRLSLLRFLLFSVTADTRVTVVTFSDGAHTSQISPAVLDLTKPGEAKASLKWIIRTNTNVSDICIPCGLKKAIDALKEDIDSTTDIVLLSLSSAVEKMDAHTFLEELENLKPRLYFLIIEDKEGAFVPGSVIHAIRRRGGHTFFLPSNLVLLNVQMNVVLSNLLKTSLHFEDGLLVVHQATFANATSSISDSFSVGGDVQGKMLYTFKCNNADLLEFKNSGCFDLDDVKDAGYECGVAEDLQPSNGSERVWQFHYTHLGGTQQLMCSSLATVTLSGDRTDAISVRGLLSDDEVSPGKNALVIYAEVLKNFKAVPGVDVEAIITRPKTNDSLVLPLRDNGNGDPDMKKGDGIYSRYFSSFTGKGIYTITIIVRSAFGDKDGDKNSRGVMRMASVGSFLVTEDPPQIDVYPPNRIADLAVVAVDHENSTVTLQWTAPGGDYDMGQVKSYEVKVSKSWTSLTDEGFNAEVTNVVLHQSDDAAPLPSGGVEQKGFKLPPTARDSVFYLAVQAVDDEGQKSVSNIVQVHATANMEQITTSTTEETETTSSGPTSTETEATTAQNETMPSSTDSYTTAADTLQPVTGISSNCTDDCPSVQHIIVLASSIGGGCLLFIILVNTIVCICCFRKRKPRKLTKRQSMLPPHNTDIIYKPDHEKCFASSSNESVDVLPEETTLARPNHPYVSLASYSGSSLNTHGRNARAKDNEYEDFRNDMQLEAAVPAYVVDTNYDEDTQVKTQPKGSSEPLTEKQKFLQDSENSTAQDDDDDAQIYHLGTV